MKMGFNVANVLPYEDVIEDLQIFENLKLSQQEVQRILMKNIIFYDLETSGLSRKEDVIHQFAALKYSPEKLNTDPDNPDDLYLSKCEVPRDVIAKKSRIVNRRAKALEKTNFENLKKALLFDSKFGGKTMSRNWNLKYNTFNDRTPYQSADPNDSNINTDDYWYEEIVLPIFFFVLMKNAIPDNKIENKAKWPDNMQIGVLDNIIYNNYASFMEYLKKDIDDNPNSNKETQTIYDTLKNVFNNTDPSIHDVRKFYNILFKDSDLLYFVVNNKNKSQVDLLKKRISQYKNLIGMSHQENQDLTHSKDFPLETFRKPEYGITMSGTRVNEVSEAQGLQGFINYITSVSPVPAPSTEDVLTLTPHEVSFPTEGDTILVGHNIVAFDNSFILERCKVHGIDPKGFSDVFVYDTRSLFEYFLRYINYSKYALNFFRYVEAGKKMPEGDEFKDLWTSSGMSKIYKGLLTKTKTLSAKLEKFMKMYNKDAKQTHTADDDCIQLAKVFNAIRPEISKVMKDTVAIIDFVENQKDFKRYYKEIRGTKTFTKKAFGKTSASKYKDAVMKKFQDVFPDDTNVSVIMKIYLDFYYPTGRFKGQQQKEFVEHMRDLLNLSTENTKKLYSEIAEWVYTIWDKDVQDKLQQKPNEREAERIKKQLNIPPVEIEDTESGAKFSVAEGKKNRRKIKVRIKK